jgi:hypothetical protein
MTSQSNSTLKTAPNPYRFATMTEKMKPEQQLHIQTLDERDEARETSWFSNGIEYRKRNDYIEARNNLNPHWVVVDSQTNQKP